MTRSLKVRLAVAVAVVAAGAFGVAYATAAVSGGGGTVVNCGVGKSLQQAIDKSSLTKPLVLTIQGTCNENVTINVNGNQKTVAVGDSLDVGASSCRVEVRSFDMFKATLVTTCTPVKP